MAAKLTFKHIESLARRHEAKEARRRAKVKLLTDAQSDALDLLAWSPETWWHDVPAGARDVLWRNGWIREVRKMKCNTPGHRHPGYVAISKKGLQVLALDNELRKSAH